MEELESGSEYAEHHKASVYIHISLSFKKTVHMGAGDIETSRLQESPSPSPSHTISSRTSFLIQEQVQWVLVKFSKIVYLKSLR